MLNRAVTLYRLVFRLVSRLEDMLPGDWGEVGRSEYEDIVGWYQGISGMLLHLQREHGLEPESQESPVADLL